MSKMYTFSGAPEGHEHLDVMHKLLKQFVPFVQKRLGFNKPVDINLVSDPQNSKDPLGKTAYYDPNNMKIALFVDKRHPKDLMRSLAHELTHHAQNCRGEFDNLPKLGKDYAQTNKHMREMEREAYEGTMLLRDFEDNLKKETTQMSESKINENERIKGLTPRAKVKVGGDEDFLSKEKNIPVSLGDKPKAQVASVDDSPVKIAQSRGSEGPVTQKASKQFVLDMKELALDNMVKAAKALGKKKWSDLPASHPARVTFRKIYNLLNGPNAPLKDKPANHTVDLVALGIGDNFYDRILTQLNKSEDIISAGSRAIAKNILDQKYGDRLKKTADAPMEEDQDLEEGKKKKKKAKKAEPKEKKSKKTAKLQNPKKADLNKDGELSGYELARGKAIEKAMGVAENKENWAKGNKDELLFETLTKKWTK